MSTPTPTSIAQQLLQFGDSYYSILQELKETTPPTSQIQTDMGNLLTAMRNYMSSIQSYASQNPAENGVMNAFSQSLLSLATADADLTNVNATKALSDAQAASADNQMGFSFMVKTAVQQSMSLWEAFVQNPTLANCQAASSGMWPIDTFLYQQIGSRGAAALASAIGISTTDLAKLDTFPAGGGFCAANWWAMQNTFLPGFQANPNYVPDPNVMKMLNSNYAAAQTVQWPV
jgi:hypothetical protein